MGDGCELLVVSILFPVFKTRWGVTEEKLDIFGSCIFFGFMFGPIIGGWLADVFGRKNAILLSTYGQFILGIASAFCKTFNAFIIVRSFYCVLIGISKKFFNK